MSRSVDVDAVTALVEHVAATVVAPRFRDLVAGEVGEKGPGDIVTVVDHAAEVAITQALEVIAPGVPVVGEEAASADPSLFRLLGAPLAWVVDPLDGTRAFVEGSPDYAVMVGLVADGVPVAGWICLPEHRVTLVAERGAGVRCNGAPLVAVPREGEPRMQVAARYLPTPARERLVGGLATRPGAERIMLTETVWSGHEYARIALGDADGMLSWRTMAWDHVPGVAIVRELGGVARRLDGRDYRADVEAEGLLVAADEAMAARVAELLDVASLAPRGPAPVVAATVLPATVLPAPVRPGPPRGPAQA